MGKYIETENGGSCVTMLGFWGERREAEKQTDDSMVREVLPKAINIPHAVIPIDAVETIDVQTTIR